MTNGQTFHFIPQIGNHVWQTDRHFISFLILETTYDWDVQTFHFIPHIGNHVWQTDRHFISFLILETTYDWDGQTFHFIPHIGNHVWQTDRHFISFLLLETTYDWDEQTFHLSYWKPRMTDGQTFHFIPHIWNHVWQTDRHFIYHIGNHVWQTDRHFISFLILETTYDRRTDISFHSSYWKPRMTETNRHFIYHIGNHVWQTDRHFISFLILETTYDRRTDNISFHFSYWKPRMTDGQTTFHFIPHIGNHVWQTDRHFISFLILETTYDWRTDISFHSSYWKPRMTDGQTTFHFIPHIGNHVWLTDRHFISFLILETTYDWRTDISFHSSYWKPRMTDGQTTFHFIPHIGNHVWQTDRHFISFLLLETTYDWRTDISFHFSYWKPRMTETDRHFISILILETKLVSDIVTAGLGIEPLTFCSAGQELNHYPTASPSSHIGIQVRQTDGQTTFHFTPHIEYSDLGENSRYTVRQTVQAAFKSWCSGLRQTPGS